MRARHIAQTISIKSIMNSAAELMPELQPLRQVIRQNLALTHFDAANELTNSGQFSYALAHLRQSLWLGPRLRHLKLLGRLGLVWAGRLASRHA